MESGEQSVLIRDSIKHENIYEIKSILYVREKPKAMYLILTNMTFITLVNMQNNEMVSP